MNLRGVILDVLASLLLMAEWLLFGLFCIAMLETYRWPV